MRRSPVREPPSGPDDVRPSRASHCRGATRAGSPSSPSGCPGPRRPATSPDPNRSDGPRSARLSITALRAPDPGCLTGQPTIRLKRGSAWVSWRRQEARPSSTTGIERIPSSPHAVISTPSPNPIPHSRWYRNGGMPGRGFGKNPHGKARLPSRRADDLDGRGMGWTPMHAAKSLA